MKRWLMIFLLPVLLLTACHQGLGEVDMDAEETAVYTVLLQRSASLWVIQQETQATGYGDPDSDWLGYINKEMPEVSQATVSSFQNRNAEEGVLDGRFDASMNVALLSRQGFDEIFQAGGWDEFHERYPHADGFTTLSRVGFNANLSQALVYMGTMSGPLAGAGYYYLLEKVDGVWQITHQVMAWIS